MEPRRFFAAVRRRLVTVLVADGFARIALVVVGVATTTALIDWSAPLPALVRGVVLAVTAAALVALAWHRLVRPLALPRDDRELAHLAERSEPALDGRLYAHVDALDLGPDEHRHLVASLTPTLVQRLVRTRGSGRRSGAAVFAVCSLAILVVAGGRAPRIAAARVLAPWSGTEWPRRQALAGSLERPVIASDEPLVVNLKRTRGGPSAVRLTWNDGQRRELRVLGSLAGPWRETLALPPGDWLLAATSGDAAPVELAARVVARPELRVASVILEPPAYAGREPRQVGTLAAEGLLPGSRLRFELVVEAGPEALEHRSTLVFEGQPVALERTGDHLTGTLEVRSGGTLAVHLEADYASPVGPEPVTIPARPQPSFTLAVGEDQRPTVRIEGVRRNETVSPRAVLDLDIVAGDDLGLAELHLDGRVLPESGEPPPSQRLVEFPDPGGLSETSRSHALGVASLAGPGQSIELQAVAVDGNDVTGPGVGRSEPLVVRVVALEALRAELDRQLAAARDRLGQARDELARASAKSTQREDAVQAARAITRRTAGLLADVARRWAQNALEEERQAPIEEAAGLVANQALDQLADALGGDEEALRSADRSLGEAERLLGSLLQSDDLLRELRSLVTRQRNLGEETSAFLLAHLGQDLDGVAGTRLQALAQRQAEQAERLSQWQQRLTSTEGPALEDARDLVARAQPADGLAEVPGLLADPATRASGAPAVQKAALATMEELLRLLAGADDTARLAALMGDLAARQEALQARLEAGGADAEGADQTQQALREETTEAERRLRSEGGDPQAARSVAGAVAAQEDTESALERGDEPEAAEAAGAAAELLRDAQRRLEGGDGGEAAEDREQREEGDDVLTVLRHIRDLQRAVVRDAALLHLAFVGDGDGDTMDFDRGRRLAPVTERQEEVLLRLRVEVLEALDQHPIARRAVTRVEKAASRAYDHLAQPALGSVGVRLTRTVLSELSRLLAIVEDLPQSDQDPAAGGEAGGPQGERAPQAAFPPRAELALLKAVQEDLSRATAGNRPGDLAAAQREVEELVGVVTEHARPGSRPHLLLVRARRAMASAAELLAGGQRGSATRNEQETAAHLLHRLLEEAQQSQGGSGGGGGGGSSSRSPEQGQSRPSEADGQEAGGPGAGGAEGESGGREAGKGGDGQGLEAAGGAVGDWMHLPPRSRVRLREALEERLPPDALRLYQRYLELLEDLE